MLNVREGQVIASKFRLTHPLARGGMGAVWAAQHETLDIPVAVKFMDPRYVDMDDLRSRFKREAKAAAQLRTPNVVQILDYGVEEKTPYLVMEFLQGEDLGQRLAREGRLLLPEAIPIFTQIGKALRRAHEAGIVHRDLKPANVFLVDHGDELLVKVLDFGIAKWLHPDLVGDATKTGTLLGSPHYMSPEQVRGLKDVDHRSDLWSLGVIVYRTLTGELPFPGAQIGDVLLKICTERPIAPTLLAADLVPEIDAFMSKALALDVTQRFQSAKEMIDALTHLVGQTSSFSAVPPPRASVPDDKPNPSEGATTTKIVEGLTEFDEQITTPLSPKPTIPRPSIAPEEDSTPLLQPIRQPSSTQPLAPQRNSSPASSAKPRRPSPRLTFAVAVGVVVLGVAAFYATKDSAAKSAAQSVTPVVGPSATATAVPPPTSPETVPTPTSTPNVVPLESDPPASSVFPSVSSDRSAKPNERPKLPTGKTPTTPAPTPQESKWGI